MKQENKYNITEEQLINFSYNIWSLAQGYIEGLHPENNDKCKKALNRFLKNKNKFNKLSESEIWGNI